MMNLRLDQMLMAAFLGAESLGLYAVAVAWSSAVAPLLSGIGFVMLPSVASVMSREHAVRLFAEGVRMTSSLAACSCLGLVLITPLAIHLLFGTAFSGSIPSALILVPAAGILGINFALQEGLRGLGYPYAVLQAELAGLVVTAIALATMLRPLGIAGAAFASLFGYSTVAISLLISAKRIARISPLSLVLPRLDEIKTSFRRVSAIARSTAAG
jgi:O-antigen/teichoic acid export membrane protein